MTRFWLRVGSRLSAILIAAFVLLLIGATPAWAHSELERSDPPNGGVIAVGRSTFTLWYTEVISAEASSFELYTSDGKRVAVRASVSEANDAGIVRLSTPPLEKATYQLDWKVLAADDGHTTHGSVVFGVGTRPAVIAPSAGGIPDPSGLLLRWVDLSAIMLAIGAVVVSARVFGRLGEQGRVARRRALLLGTLGAGVAVVSGAITPFLLTQRGGGSFGEWFDATWATLSDTGWGHLWLAREVALVITAAALYRATRSGNTVNGPANSMGGRLRIAVVALGAVVGLESWAGHAASLPSGSVVAVFASATHLVAAGVWVGGLATLVICLIPMMRHRPDTRRGILESAWRAFGPVAAVAAAVLVATGIYEAGVHIPDLSFAVSTVYGGTVVVKLVLVIVALLLAAINTVLVSPGVVARVAPRLAPRVGRLLGLTPAPLRSAPLPSVPVTSSPRRLRRFATVVAAEALILVVAVGAAGLLTSVPTAREVATATRQTVLHTATVDGLFVTFEQVAAGPSQSRLIVRARSIVKLEPAPVTRVQVTLAGPTNKRDVTFEQIEPGRYEAETATPTPGAWSASVVLEREGLPAAMTKIGWTVSADSTEGVRPLQLVTTAVALLLLAAMVGALLLIRRRRAEAVATPELHPPVTPTRETEEVGSRR